MRCPIWRRAHTPGIFIGFALCLFALPLQAADRTEIYAALPDIRMNAGKDVTFIELEDGGHGLRLHENRIRTMRETVDFINRHLAVSD